VFADLRVDTQPEAFAGLPVDAVLAVGGRLLVAVCASRPWNEVSEQLESCFATGRRLREAGGYNRFRLVVATGVPDEARHAMARRFERLAKLDERVHLHVVGPAILPDALK
jgi:hypothetical protein